MMKLLMLSRTMIRKKLFKNLTSCVKFWRIRGDVMGIGEEQYMLIEQLQTLQNVSRRVGKIT